MEDKVEEVENLALTPGFENSSLIEIGGINFLTLCN